MHKGILQTAIAKWLKQGIIEPSTAVAAYNPVFAPKADGTLRVCIDYSPLNPFLVDAEWPLPRIAEIRFRLRGATRFSRIDLREAFHILRIPEGHRDPTTFISHLGKFRFTRMPFGLKTAPAFFQRFMDHVLRLCYKFAIWYQDDILVFSDEKTHTDKLSQVLGALSESGCEVNQEKSEYNKSQIDFVGLRISKDMIGCALSTEELRTWKVPTSVKAWQSLMGFLNCFRSYVPGFADLSAGLWPTADSPRPDLREGGIEQARTLILRCMTKLDLHQYDDAKPGTLFTDASLTATGAVLTQEGKVIAVHSKGLTGPQSRYSTTDRESLALLHGVEAFRVFIQSEAGCEVATDHSALLTRRAEELTPRQERWQYRIKSIVRKVIFVKGAENPADYWSREGARVMQGRTGMVTKVRSLN